jgi:hypothetical protein
MLTGLLPTSQGLKFMIERIVYKGNLPAFYEVTTWSESDDTFPKETGVIQAEMLDDAIADTGMSREDAVYRAASAHREAEGVPDLRYCMKLMRPAATRQYLRPFVRYAIWETTMDRVAATLPFDLDEDPANFIADMTTVEAFGRGF